MRGVGHGHTAHRPARETGRGYAHAMRREFPANRRPSKPAVPEIAGTAGPLWGLPTKALLAGAFFFIACGLVWPADAATLWRKRGANGEWVYFDRPTAGAEPYEFTVYTPGISSSSSGAASGGQSGSKPGSKPVAAPRAAAPAQREPVAGGPPRAVEVLFPANDAVIQFGDVPHLVARARVEPSLNGGQQLWWSLNGQALRGEAAEAALRVLPRGSHTLQARVLDGAGRLLLESKPVTFHVRQNSVATPPVGPALRKPPPPPPKG